MVGIRAAAWLGLPTFEYALMRITEDGLVSYRDGSESKAGLAFVTRWEDGTPWGGAEEDLQGVENPEAISGLVVLDTWLLNCDRFRKEPPRHNVRNVFLTTTQAGKGKYRVLAMDHTHCFSCGRELTPRLSNIGQVKQSQIHGNFPAFQGYISGKAVATYLGRLGRLDRNTAESFVAGAPREWEVSDETTDAIVAPMVDRAKYLADNCGRLLVEQGCLASEFDFEGKD